MLDHPDTTETVGRPLEAASGQQINPMPHRTIVCDLTMYDLIRAGNAPFILLYERRDGYHGAGCAITLIGAAKKAEHYTTCPLKNIISTHYVSWDADPRLKRGYACMGIKYPRDEQVSGQTTKTIKPIVIPHTTGGAHVPCTRWDIDQINTGRRFAIAQCPTPLQPGDSVLFFQQDDTSNWVNQRFYVTCAVSKGLKTEAGGKIVYPPYQLIGFAEPSAVVIRGAGVIA